jgi:hypothetical protein
MSAMTLDGAGAAPMDVVAGGRIRGAAPDLVV